MIAEFCPVVQLNKKQLIALNQFICFEIYYYITTHTIQFDNLN